MRRCGTEKERKGTSKCLSASQILELSQPKSTREQTREQIRGIESAGFWKDPTFESQAESRLKQSS